MTITQLLLDCPSLTEPLIHQAYALVVRMVKLHPILVTVSCNAIKLMDITNIPLTVIKIEEGYGEVEYPVKIKEIAEIICSSRLEEIPEALSIYAAPELELKLGVTNDVSGSVYYANNTISTTTGAVFVMSCYCMPEMLSEELLDEDDEPYTEYDVPDHLVILTLCKALSLKSEEADDVEQTMRYETILTQLVNSYNLNAVGIDKLSKYCFVPQLVNSYNLNAVEFLPNSLVQGFTPVPYGI